MDEAKAERLKAALRENLRRRKRVRPALDGKVPPDTDKPAPTCDTGNDEGA